MNDPPPKKVFPNYTGVEQLQFIPLHFSTYDNWKEMTTECPNCGWTGLLGDAGFELYAACAEVNCRKCQNGLAVIEYPTTQEAEAAGDEATVAMHKYMKSRRESFERAKLQSVDQLPDIPDSEFVLRWIGHEQTGHSAYMEIKYKGEVIHREAMFFEDGKRYGEVCAILKEKYGSRLIDVLPNYTGWVYLGGDAFSSLQAAKDARLKLFGRTTVPRDFNTEE